MNLLLDTHTALWFWWDDPKLSETAKQAIVDAENRKLISTASCWEIAIKVSLQKLELGAPFRGFIPQQMRRCNFESLTIHDDHLAALVDLPFHHRDPFDRLLVAQARWDNIPSFLAQYFQPLLTDEEREIADLEGWILGIL